MGPKEVLTVDEEFALYEYVQELAELGYPVTPI